MESNVAVFFGGQSCEHDISILTGIQVLHNLDPSHNIYPIYIHSGGIWYTGRRLWDISSYADFDPKRLKLKKVCVLPYDTRLFELRGRRLKPICEIDCAVLAMHGVNGEDGSLAGLLQLSGIPQTSTNVLGGALGMDKIAMKVFFEGLGLKVLPYTYFERRQYMYEQEKTLQSIEEALGYPVIVKPSMLGSSIGIKVCSSRQELIEGIETAIRFDRRVLVERAEEEFIEINCAAFKTCGAIRATECERPISWRHFLSFEDKYLGGEKGMASAGREFPADIDEEISDRIKEITKKIYRSLNLKGVVRADFIVSDDIYINEINTIPGSLSFYLWEHEGITFTKLLDMMIKEAREDHRDFKKCAYSFKSPALSLWSGGQKSPKLKKN